MTIGYVALVLHAHLPFLRHPEREDYLEERWLYEAVCECYLPLLEGLERLAADQIPFRLTLSLSPPLMAMLDDPLLRMRVQRYLERSIALAERELAYTAGGPAHLVAHFYHHRLRTLHRAYLQTYRRDLLSAFAAFARAGYLELITSAATHGFLPAYEGQPAAVRAQIRVAVAQFQRRFGFTPRGFWLPECGYFPGLDAMLREAGIQYAFVETHGLTHARPSPPMGPYAHAWTPGGLAVFARDPESSKQVWSTAEGYPGDGAYREFYRDIGFEREPEHLGPLAGSFTGLKYHRVTGPTEQKALYDRWAAELTAIRHAGHFVAARRRQVGELRGTHPDGPPPVIVAPYDAELFGHWWFEGPFFLEQVARQAHRQELVRFITPSDYLAQHGEGQGWAEPSYSSWGDQGYADFWIDGTNHWLYRHLHGAGRQMERLAAAPLPPDGAGQVALAQAARELLLAQGSDWAFILRTGTAADYARRRIQQHLGRFQRIASALEQGQSPDPAWLAQVAAADNLFPDLDGRIYAEI